MTASTWDDRLAFSFACTFRSHSEMLVLFPPPPVDVILERLEPFRTVALIIWLASKKWPGWRKPCLEISMYIKPAEPSQGEDRNGRGNPIGREKFIRHSSFQMNFFSPADFIDIFIYLFIYIKQKNSADMKMAACTSKGLTSAQVFGRPKKRSQRAPGRESGSKTERLCRTWLFLSSWMSLQKDSDGEKTFLYSRCINLGNQNKAFESVFVKLLWPCGDRLTIRQRSKL